MLRIGPVLRGREVIERAEELSMELAEKALQSLELRMGFSMP
jgi:hypothetical protein